MKTLSYLMMLPLPVLLALYGCEKGDGADVTDEKPVLTLTTDGDIAVPAAGGQYLITYSIENPAESGEITPSCPETWIGNWDTSVPGTVAFTVEAYTEEVSREAQVSVTYSYPEGEQSVSVKIIQEGVSSEEPPVDYTDAFTIDVSEITSTSARVVATCNYDDLRWTTQLASEAALVEQAGGKDNVGQWLIETLRGLAEDNNISLSEYLDYFLLLGSDTDDYRYEGLSPATVYLTYSVGMDLDGNYLTDFYWGEEFTTETVETSGLTFEVEIVPSVNSAQATITPSDSTEDDYWLAEIIDGSYFEEGYVDEQIMQEIIDSYGYYVMWQLSQGRETKEFTGLEENTDYWLVVFGVDYWDEVPSTGLSSYAFRTLERTGDPAVAQGNLNLYWSIDDLVAHNPEYASYRTSSGITYIAALDMTYGTNAEGAYYGTWTGDMTSMGSALYNIIIGYDQRVNKGDPTLLLGIEEPYQTLVTIGIDGSGAAGELYCEYFTFTEDGASQDFALFDEYHNALSASGSAASAVSSGKVHRAAGPAAKNAASLRHICLK